MKFLKRLFFCLLIVGSLAAGGYYGWLMFFPQPPNIVLIIIDTLRADKLGFYGFPEYVSPELDQFARKGVVFSNVYAQCSWTRPSIGSMLTSKYPRTLGIYSEEEDSLNDDFVTLAELLQANNYTTLGLTANPNINSYFNFQQGFDVHIDSTLVYEFMDPGEEQVVFKNAKTQKLKTTPEVFKVLYRILEKQTQPPYFLQLTLMEIHESGKNVHIRPEYRKLFRRRWSYSKRYLQSVMQMSCDLGKELRKLLALPGWENTMLILCSDHGEGLRDHYSVEKSRTHGSVLYNSNIKVPMIIYYPAGNWKPTIIEQPVRLADLMPTLLDYLDIEPPEGIIGRSLLPLIEGTQESVLIPDFFVAETDFRDADKIALMTEEWKYILNRKSWRGVNAEELQPAYIKENGKRTDKIQQKPKIAEMFDKELAKWEARYDKAEETTSEEALPEAMRAQLESIGYLK